MTADSLKHHLLIAMPQLADPNFHHSVTYLIEHNADGAMGLTLNRPMEASLMDVFADLEIECLAPPSDRHQLVSGGPVQPEAGFILHPPTDQVWQNSVPVDDQLWLTTSRDILEAIATGNGPDRSLLALGYAGWSAGQLEQEMVENAWLSTPATADLIFEVPADQRWQSAAARLGIDLNLISTEAGHS